MFALMPPRELALRIEAERLRFAEKYNCVKALKPPVHITLFNPFKSPTDIEHKFTKIQQWATLQTPFSIELINYNFFANPVSPVVYIDVAQNENLKILHKQFLKQLRNYIEIQAQSNKYKPHFTIGYRDISANVFPAIVKEYSSLRFSASFVCDCIFLWKHNGVNWQIQNEFGFMGNSQKSRQQPLF